MKFSNRGSTKSRERPFNFTTRTRRLTKTGSTATKKKTAAEEEPPKAQKHKSIDSDEDDEEPRNESGTSSNTQPSVPLLPYNYGNEDSEYSDEKSAQSRDSERTLYHPDLRSDKWWALDNDVRDTQMKQRLDHLVFKWLKMESNRTYAIWSLCRVYNDHCTSIKWPTMSRT